MSISIKDAKAVAPFETFDIDHFGVHVNSAVVVKENNLNIWTISLMCVLDISEDEPLPELVKVEMSDTQLCCGLIPVRTITLSPKEHKKGDETLWLITLEAELEIIDIVRILDIEVNITTRRPRRNKARTMAQVAAS